MEKQYKVLIKPGSKEDLANYLKYGKIGKSKSKPKNKALETMKK